MEESEILKYLRNYKGKEIEVATEDNRRYKGSLIDVYVSLHNGIGNVILENENSRYLIRGSCIKLIILEKY